MNAFLQYAGLLGLVVVFQSDSSWLVLRIRMAALSDHRDDLVRNEMLKMIVNYSSTIALTTTVFDSRMVTRTIPPPGILPNSP
jgi:hypothetical protein